MKKNLLKLLTVCAVAVTATVVFSSFTDGGGVGDEAEEGIDGFCYAPGSVLCGSGTMLPTCFFTGYYGDPTSCTSYDCNSDGGLVHHCVLKKS